MKQKIISLRVNAETYNEFVRKAKEQNQSISDYLRNFIFQNMTKEKPLTLNECLNRLEYDIAVLNIALQQIPDITFQIEKIIA
ncbi:MAG: hypothetical protein QW270_06695 [Candidatus Bathyarchaeia archaeon]